MTATFTGLASATGVLDRGGDVIAPGAFSTCLPRFLKNGFIALAHQWESLPVGFPLAAFDGPKGLILSAAFHHTAAAQEAATMIGERLKQAMPFGLSVGFRPSRTGMKGFRNGAELLRFGQKHRLLMGENPAIAAMADPCRLIWEVEDLFEVSLVPVPMNPLARVLNVTG